MNDMKSKSPVDKVLGRSEARTLVGEWKEKGLRVVFTNGCFDILHRGHVQLLSQAAALGDRLVVGLNKDESVQRLEKGKERPIIDERSRAIVLASLHCVDAVVPFEEDTPLELIRTFLPDVLVKGGDYSEDEVVGKEVVEANGGRVVLLPLLEGYSTSAIVDRILGADKGREG